MTSLAIEQVVKCKYPGEIKNGTFKMFVLYPLTSRSGPVLDDQGMIPQGKENLQFCSVN